MTTNITPIRIPMEDAPLHTASNHYRCGQAGCVCETYAALDLARIAREQAEAKRLEVQAFLDQATFRQKRMERQEAAGFTALERAVLDEQAILDFVFFEEQEERNDA